MKLKLLLTILAATLTLTTPVYGMTCKELVEDYLSDEDIPKEPFLVETTGYIHGNVCSHGDKPREGIVAGAPEWYGLGCIIYEAIPDESGYHIGDQLMIAEIRDTGYGKTTRDGVQSDIRQDKASRGTIETGKSIDRYCESMAKAQAWMKRTNGHIFIQLVDGRG